MLRPAPDFPVTAQDLFRWNSKAVQGKPWPQYFDGYAHVTVHFADTSGGDGEDGRDRGELLTGGEHSHAPEGMLAVDGADLSDLEREVHRAVFEVPQPPADAVMTVVGGRVGQAEAMQLDVGFCQREQRIEVACNECAQETAYDLSNVLVVIARELWGPISSSAAGSGEHSM